ncbi:MAG TPA: biopolymer transporter ExbD [Verrucomicrobiae bacterium]|nr:biopolymer transporter ExbD [Verrucomicrobiae bacterium]
MKGRRSITDTEELNEINISPLIDMVFILLIFFIVTTVFVEETGVDINRPDAASASQLEKNSILIAVTSQNQVVFGQRDIGVAGVRALVKRLTTQEPEMPVIIQADEGSLTGMLVRVVDEAKLGGARTVNVATKK